MTVVPLEPARHGKACVAPPPDMNYAVQLNHAVLGLDEVALAAADYPLVMLKDAYSGQFHLAALFGLAENSNLFVLNGRWHATYLPVTVLRYPFYFDESAPFGLSIDEDSSLLGNDGERLFDDSQQPTLVTRDMAAKLGQMARDRAAMSAFVNDVAARRLLQPLRIELRFEDGSSTKVAGIYGIDPLAIEGLDGASLAELNQVGHLAPMHVMIASLAQFNRLEQLHNARAEKRLACVNLL